jgi:hypothetical protein
VQLTQQQIDHLGGWTREQVLALPERWQEAFRALSSTQGMAWQCDDQGLDEAMRECLATLHQEAQQRGLL